MENNWKKLKVLIAGCGSIGKRHSRILTSLGVENIMVFDNNQKQVELLLNEFPDVKFVSTFQKGLEMVEEHFPDVHPEYKSLYYAKYSGAFELMHDLDPAIWIHMFS